MADENFALWTFFFMMKTSFGCQLDKEKNPNSELELNCKISTLILRNNPNKKILIKVQTKSISLCPTRQIQIGYPILIQFHFKPKNLEKFKINLSHFKSKPIMNN
ncbi:hypothetical protein BpHYR1_007079 [Brachionus plicatilis]|uniref:Uncharacterized protein n=1 Tax=Brachionus plicatilis TaxID=10195 RepID=A0A3M7PMG0_BRAPC|nr:hypothetical protein BpHYR1_007079 [Brachionus plicatilis]